MTDLEQTPKNPDTSAEVHKQHEHSHHHHHHHHHHSSTSQLDELRKQKKRERRQQVLRIIEVALLVLCIACIVVLWVGLERLRSDINALEQRQVTLPIESETESAAPTAFVPGDVLVPKTLCLSAGTRTDVYTASLFPKGTEGFSVAYTCEDAAFAVTTTGFSLSPTAAGTFDVKVTATSSLAGYTPFEAVIAVTVVDETAVKDGFHVMLLGDSRFAGGLENAADEAGLERGYNHVAETLAGLFGADALVGTQTDKNGYRHEGRDSWKAKEYILETTSDSNRKENLFYDLANTYTDAKTGVAHHFSFAYYLEKTGVTVPDAVVIYLGANDDFSERAAEYVRIMAESIVEAGKSLGREIRVYVMTEYYTVTEPTAISMLKTADALTSKKNKQAAFNHALTEALGGKQADGITLLSADAVIGATADHPTDPATGKVVDLTHLSDIGSHKIGDFIAAALFRDFAK